MGLLEIIAGEPGKPRERSEEVDPFGDFWLKVSTSDSTTLTDAKVRRHWQNL